MIDILMTQYANQGGVLRTNMDAYSVGRMLSWRNKLYAQLLPQDKSLAYSMFIARAIESDLDSFQNAMENIIVARLGNIMDQTEFTQRLINLTLAAHIKAITEGSELGLNESYAALVDHSLESGGDADIIGLDLYDAIPLFDLADALTKSIDAMITNPAQELASIIQKLAFGERAKRIVMWITSVLGSYTLGQLYLPDDVLLQWLASILKQNCRLCQLLDGQVHYVVDWRNWYKSTNLKPQSHDLDCGGWQCGCIYIKTLDNPSGLLPLG